MFLHKTEINHILANRINFFCRVVAMIVCICYVAKQKQCRLFFFFRKCSKCVRSNKKCEFAISFVNFDVIDRTMTKLKREKLEIEATWEIALEQSRLTNELIRIKLFKLKRLRQQKKFFKQKKQKLFDKSLSNVKELKYLKDLKKSAEVERNLVNISFFSEFVKTDVLISEIFNWLNRFFSVDEIFLKTFDNLSDFWMTFTYSLNVNILFTWWDNSDLFFLKFFPSYKFLLSLFQNETFFV